MAEQPREPADGGQPADDHVAPADRSRLLYVADAAIRAALVDGRPCIPEPTREGDFLQRPGAAFVTLRRDGRLLGCIGSMEPRRPLVVDVAENAVAAAFHDPRMPPLTGDDYRQLEIKVSVLTPLTPVDVADRDELTRVVRPGVDGLLLTAPGHRGTFLPSVWEQLPSVEDFLDHLWLKAGLRTGTWPAGLVVERYRTEEFGSLPPRELTGR